ncbi:hypothetical protein PoB_000229900 [Plakobranchus ocellatus]|uniref:Uncharacterized protein n=1 Tax=Plakobranchus ocellatus TaxID=259542 RepID=A0AAV3XY63_9GAST|nr:hypothetical protein PoB_000229900 [Plakobranchus ocellatus]
MAEQTKDLNNNNKLIYDTSQAPLFALRAPDVVCLRAGVKGASGNGKCIALRSFLSPRGVTSLASSPGHDRCPGRERSARVSWGGGCCNSYIFFFPGSKSVTGHPINDKQLDAEQRNHSHLTWRSPPTRLAEVWGQQHPSADWMNRQLRNRRAGGRGGKAHVSGIHVSPTDLWLSP